LPLAYDFPIPTEAGQFFYFAKGKNDDQKVRADRIVIDSINFCCLFLASNDAALFKGIQFALSPGVEVLGIGLQARPPCERFIIEVQIAFDLCKVTMACFELFGDTEKNLPEGGT
jgi:hypothetical protein